MGVYFVWVCGWCCLGLFVKTPWVSIIGLTVVLWLCYLLSYVLRIVGFCAWWVVCFDYGVL